jgi:hypothetical protein
LLLQPLTSKSFTGKFKTISVILHGFEAVAGQLSLNGKRNTPKESVIDFFNSIKPTDPLWFDSRKMEQKVLVIDGVNANKENEISW